MGDTDPTHDLIRARLDEIHRPDGVLAETIAALRAVLDRLDNGYCSTCDPAYRNIIADALGVTHD